MYKECKVGKIEDNHHVYVDVCDADGNDLRSPQLKIEYEWEGMQPHEKPAPVPLDKPVGEHAGNFPLNPGMTARLRIIPGPSEWVEKLPFYGVGSWLVEFVWEGDQP